MEMIEVEIRLPKEAGEQEIADLPDGAVQAQKEKMPERSSGTQLSFDPILIVAVAVPVTWIVERIVDHFLPKREQGALVDFSADKPVLSTVAGVSKGTLIIRKPNGDVEVHKDSPRASVVDALMSGFKMASRISDG